MGEPSLVRFNFGCPRRPSPHDFADALADLRLQAAPNFRSGVRDRSANVLRIRASPILEIFDPKTKDEVILKREAF